MNISENLIGGETLRAMAQTGNLELTLIRKEPDGFSLHVRAGNLRASYQTKRGFMKVWTKLDTLVNYLGRVGINTFQYENEVPAEKAPVQENLMFATPRRKPSPAQSRSHERKSA